MSKLASKIGAVLHKQRLLHYADIFIATFVVTLFYERDRVLGAHGLNALGAVAFAATVAGGKAVVEAYRKSGAPKS